MSNIKSDIINNVTVTMSVYIQDREALDVLELVLANELMKVNVEEITTLPAEVKSSVDQRNAYLVQLFMIQKRHLKKRAKIQCRVYPHKMRKTLGMDLKQHGLDIGIIQEILGHASPAVTSMYYAQSTTESLRSVRQRLSA